MSDTKALIKYVRDRLNDGPNITFGKPTVLNLVEALEQAEARAKDNSEALTAAYMSGKYDGRKEAEANVARLNKMVDWLAMHLSGYDAQKKCTVYAAYWKESARRAVASAESGVKG